jgi:predicted transcriptional regulator
MTSFETLPIYPSELALLCQPIAIVIETAPVGELRDLLIELRVPAIAVVDAERSLCGVVTRTDVLRGLGDPDATARDVMSGFVFALPVDSSIECAAALMAIEGVGQIVITARDGALLGMVSALDIARHLAVRAGYLAA